MWIHKITPPSLMRQISIEPFTLFCIPYIRFVQVVWRRLLVSREGGLSSVSYTLLRCAYSYVIYYIRANLLLCVITIALYFVNKFTGIRLEINRESLIRHKCQLGFIYQVTRNSKFSLDGGKLNWLSGNLEILLAQKWE